METINVDGYEIEIRGSSDITNLVKLRNRRVYVEDSVDLNDKFVSSDIDFFTDVGTDPINIYLSSYGGDAFGGLKIIGAIARAKVKGIKIYGVVRGTAMSMAFILLQYCDHRVMGNGDILMAHGVKSGYMSSDIRNMEAESRMLKELSDTFMAKLVEKISASEPSDPVAKSAEYWAPIMKDDKPVYYTASEALAMGLVDEVEER